MGDLIDMSGRAVKAPEQAIDLLEVQKEMLDTIERVDQYCINKGKLGGLDWGMPSLNKAFEGLQPGLIMVGGQPNIGKTCLCIQMAWKIAYANTRIIEGVKPYKAYVIYFSLDDNATEVIPRIVALEENIPINVVKAPAKYEDDRPDLLSRRASGINKLKDMLDHFKIIDSTQGSSVEFIEDQIRRHHTELRERDENYKLVVLIDNFHDISVESVNFRDNENGKITFLSDKLSQICTKYDIPIICTAEFRKLNGNRRPVIDDLKESGKIGYEAKAIMLCYNEVGIRGESASVYFNRGEEEYARFKQPVLEVKIGKNKYSDFKGRLFFNFYPERNILQETDETEAMKYSQMII